MNALLTIIIVGGSLWGLLHYIASRCFDDEDPDLDQ